MDRRTLTHGFCIAALALAVACASLLAAHHGGDALTGIPVTATAGIAAIALLLAHRAREESRAGMEAAAALARWMSLTNLQLAAVRDCGRSIEAAIVELDEQIDVLLAAGAAPRSSRTGWR
jgi:hypothetical protein